MNELGAAVGHPRPEVKYQAINSGVGTDLCAFALIEALHRVGYRPLPVLHVHPSTVVAAEHLVREVGIGELHIVGDDRIEDVDEWFVTYYGEAAGSSGA